MHLDYELYYCIFTQFAISIKKNMYLEYLHV